jgi:hypothetical protein
LLIADCLAFVAERKCGLGRKAGSHVCICLCVSWVCVRVCVCVCARWRTGYELRQERQHGAPTRLDMRMPFFMAGVVACGNSAGLDLDASSCSGCGAGSDSDSRAAQSSVRPQSYTHTRGALDVAHTDTHNPHASHWRWRSTRFIITVVHARHVHLSSACLCASEQARLVTPAHPKSYVVYNMQRPYQYDSTSTAQSSSLPSQCVCTSIIQSQA